MSRKVAVITGAGRGIGRAVAIELSRLGFDLALIARTASELADTADSIGSASLQLTCDVTDAEAIQQAVAATLDRFGRIDCVVNNAGSAPMKSIEHTTPAIWREVIETNLSSAFYLSHAAWESLKATGGSIVNISSEASRDPLPGFVAYASAKGGVNLLTLMLHREGKPHGIRAYAVAPGAVETQMLRAIIDKTQFPESATLDPNAVARVVGSCVAGELQHSSGEVIFVHR